MKPAALAAAALYASAFAAACKHEPAAGKASAAGAGSVVVLEAPPSMPIRLGIDFDGRVELLGASLVPATELRPGTPVKLTLYWRKLGDIDDEFRLFTHVLDAAGERLLNLDGVGPLRRLERGVPKLPPADWQEGKVYVDEQSFTLPSSVRTDTLRIVAGLYYGERRLPVRRGAHTADRGIVATPTVARGATRSLSSVPELWVPRLPPGPRLVIDGQLDEPAWARAGSSAPFVNVRTGEPDLAAHVSGSVKLLYDDEALYVAFDVQDEDLRGSFDRDQPDPQLWTSDTVEIMLDPDGDGDNLDYYELQIGPQNLIFDSQFDAYNQPRVEPNGPFGHQEWSAQAKSAVRLRGTLNDAVEDEGYVVEAALPWKAFSKAKQAPPVPGAVWRMNFYAMQDNGGTAWSPILGQGNFHKASRFGRVRFGR